MTGIRKTIAQKSGIFTLGRAIQFFFLNFSFSKCWLQFFKHLHMDKNHKFLTLFCVQAPNFSKKNAVFSQCTRPTSSPNCIYCTKYLPINYGQIEQVHTDHGNCILVVCHCKNTLINQASISSMAKINCNQMQQQRQFQFR